MCQQGVARRQSSPLPGNSPHDRPVSRGIGSPGRICDDPSGATLPLFNLKNNTERSVLRFWRHGGIYLVRWGFKPKPKPKPKPRGGTDRLPLVGPAPSQKNASGGPRSFSSSADEFRPGYSSIGLLASIA